MRLSETFEWHGRTIAWGRRGTGPALVFCHGTPWSSALWEPYAEALSREFTVYLWDMPGYGRSSMNPEHPVGLDVQGALFADLLAYWRLERAHVVAHDYGGAVSLRAALLHDAAYSSLALVDVVALRPWGSDYFRLVRDNADAFAAQPAAVHEGALRAYIAGASNHFLSETQMHTLAEPWLGEAGQPAFYRQIAAADERFTEDLEPLLPTLRMPTLIVWGTRDAWIPVDRARRLAELIPGAELELIDDAGHLIQLDAPVQLATSLRRWLGRAADAPTGTR
ncbi:MAG: alpha/beta fold hydrolase [Nocardioidaceae bacterium]